MRLTQLAIRDVRSLRAVDLMPAPGLNMLVGDNGAGKTSVLEAIHLLAHGRSFRGRVRDGLIRSGADAVEVIARWSPAPEALDRQGGMRHAGDRWQARLDGETVGHLGELCAAFASICLEPASPQLMSASSDTRRRFVDFGLFHVEHGYLDAWRRYTRALKQRNALLKGGNGGGQLDAWDAELADAARPVASARRRYLDALESPLQAVLAHLAPDFGRPRIESRPGWRAEHMDLGDALLLARPRDLVAGHTSVGPHRGDWSVVFEDRPFNEALSRGQGKLLGLACLLAQARLHAQHRGAWPVMLLDDLGSELDARRRTLILSELQTVGAQVFMTGVEPLPELDPACTAMFHVEHGSVIRRQG